ncbi:MAG: RluA family pseudouridine synthase [Candidatus Omnitrophota bacterium]
MNEYIFKASPEDAGKRLDVFIMEYANKEKLGISRMHLKKIVEDKMVFLNGADSTKPHHKVKADDEVRIQIKDKEIAALLCAEDIPLDVVYEDESLAVINKQIGLVVHPAPGNLEHTLVNALMYRFKKLSSVNPQRPGIVHRLDKETSGLLVIAKNNVAHLDLAKQFAEHSIKRQYVALVSGKMEFDENVIEVPIGRHPHKRKSMSASYAENTKYAKTYYRTLTRADNYSMLELEPFTGRTHQLRVHLAFIGHPILGDTKYGKAGVFKRLALHAKYIGFIHPGTGKFVEFDSEIPEEFKMK